MVEVNQKVKVITFFGGGKIFPVKMSWNEKIINFQKLVFHSSRKVGDEKIHSFVVESLGAVYELEFSNQTYQWVLTQLQPME